MIKFKTQSGSMYELHRTPAGWHMYKYQGVRTARQVDGRLMLNTDEPVVGQPYIMVWGMTAEGVIQTTITSPVTEVTYA